MDARDLRAPDIVGGTLGLVGGPGRGRLGQKGDELGKIDDARNERSGLFRGTDSTREGESEQKSSGGFHSGIGLSACTRLTLTGRFVKTRCVSRGKWMVLFIVVAALVVRLIGIDQPFIDPWSWRQSDVAAIARNFLENGFHFTRPQIDWAGDQPGYVGTEFPILPFTAALVYRSAGVQEWIGRIQGVLLFVAALPFFFGLVRRIFGEVVAGWATKSGSSVADLARAARVAAVPLALAGRAVKDAALLQMATALREHTDDILQANKEDVVRAEAAGTDAAMIDRLRLDAGRVDAMAAGLEQLASLPDPIGEVIRGSVTTTGLRLEQVRVPLGVIGIIYEGRPNVTADAAGICLKSGNACLLRGSSSAADSNAAIISVLRSAIEDVGLPADCITGIGGDRETVKELMQARGLVDLLIPRGGAGLIQTVVRESTVPVIETGVGNVHIFVDATADLAKALPIILNAKTQRPSVCNAAETLLVHRDIARRSSRSSPRH